MTKLLLIVAAVCDMGIAGLHVFIIAEGSWAYRLFGAGETMATLADNGSWIPAAITSSIVLAALLAAAWYLAAAGVVPKPPLLHLGLWAVALVYTLRGAALLPGLLILDQVSAFDLWSSSASLTIGLIHLAGVIQMTRSGRPVVTQH
ncbi:MAG: hypothetical protein FWF36_00390 [Propionibacteriaceae bacterium]|nr:hypothetical protein [Propionibacteriaceae bacterium]